MNAPKLSHRIFAGLFDTFIVFALVLIALIPSIVSLINVLISDNAWNVVALYISSVVSGALALVFIILYHIVLPVYLNGQSLGKKYFNIMIVKNNGSPVDFRTMFIRELVRVFVLLTSFGLSIFVDLITLSTSRGRVSFYDTLSSTSVVDVLVE